MPETLREVINKFDDLYTFSINKQEVFDRYTWEFTITDKKSDLYGLTGKLANYPHKIVTLRRGEHFFIAYKFLFSDKNVYFVDIKKANHKTSVAKYVDGIVKFYMKSNDISYKKSDSSFKISEMKMKSIGINNFIDLCYYFSEYSAIGIGYTRDVRNLIVLDIDVDCRLSENNNELNRILKLFALNNILPDFEIHNNENGHIQLQWLIQPHQYKKRNEERIKELILKFSSEKNKNKEINVSGGSLDYTIDAERSGEYRLLTRCLTDISNKPNFGDKNFTFWKAKNFCTALFHMQNLELKMPQYRDGNIVYLSQEEMLELFSTKEKRKLYCDESPTFDDIVFNSKDLLSNFIELEKKSIDKDVYCDYDDSVESNYREREIYEDSRNNFVFKYTKTVTWDICRDWKLKSFSDITKLSKEDYKKLEGTVHKIVRDEYDKKNKQYGGGKWPGTSNGSRYSKKEFEAAFKNAFNFAKCKFNNLSKYTDEQRDNSMRERGLKKDMKLVLVDYYRNKNKRIKRDDLLKIVNETLKKSNQKEISLSSLKRYIGVSKSMTSDDRERLYTSYYENFKERKDEMSSATNNMKNIKKKKFDYISINIIDDIMKNI